MGHLWNLDVNDPRKCYQMTISIGINIPGGCATVYITSILAIWFKVVDILKDRSPMVARFVKAGKLRIYQALRSDFLEDALHFRLDILGICFLIFTPLDLKISNIHILADAKENEWTVGQISPMILLLSVPTTIARAAWGYVIASIFKVYRYYR
jgi:hypothetical protein